jgi:SAM-dependent methyltransferase
VASSHSTISDFSEQWTTFSENSGYFASEDLLQDHFGPLLDVKDVAGARVCEVGSGNGRFVNIFARYARSVVAIEPSEAVAISRKYNAPHANVEHLQKDIFEVDEDTRRRIGRFDWVFCIGVLQFLADPVEGLVAMKRLLAPGGSLVVWVYGKENNGAYLLFVKSLRLVTTRVPHHVLMGVARMLAPPLRAYIAACRFLPLPMRAYLRRVLAKCDHRTLVLNIYDQLNPRITAYWSKAELETMLGDAGFSRVELYHRHGYSWTARARV